MRISKPVLPGLRTKLVAIASLVVLLSLLPTLGPGATTRPPAVALDRITVTDLGAAAPIVGGGTARLTLEPRLQKAAARLLALAHPSRGAVVAVDVPSGHVLAWTEYQRGKTEKSVLRSADAPAASVFKIVTTASLIEKKVSPRRRVCFRGGQHGIEQRHLRAPSRGEMKCAPFGEALGFSRNAVYAQLATRFLGPDALLRTARRLGFGAEVPFDVPIPVGDVELPHGGKLAFARAAAGFEGSTLSPLGAAHLVYTLALSGRIGRMYLVDRAGEYAAPKRRRLLGRALREPVAYELRRMLEVTVHSGTSLDVFTKPDGTSYVGSTRVAGKTGTLKPSRDAPTTTWFTGFAPSARPRVVVAVMLQDGPVWRRRANEVARDVLRAYLADRTYRGVTHPLRQAD